MTNRSAGSSSDAQRSRLLIVGCGYVGERAAALATAAGQEVFALTRSESRINELQAAGCQPIVGSWHEPETLQQLPCVDRILVAIPHREEHTKAFDLAEDTHVAGLENLSKAIASKLQHNQTAPRWIYLSTTGVFGECDGEVLNEDSPVSPTRIGPKIAVAAERWIASNLRERATVIRLAGIYGPGRVPLAAHVRSGEPLAVPLDGYLNLVHVDDIAQVIQLAFERPLDAPVYLLSDGHPVIRREFYEKLAQLCGVETPQFAPPATDSPKARRATSKRVDPSRIVTETNYHFVYPSYREGLAQTLGK